MALEASETGGTVRSNLEGPRSVHAATFSALRSRQFRAFWYAVLVSENAFSIQFFAVGWFVVQLARQEGVPSRASLYAGLMGLALAAPVLVLGIFTGAIIDRVDRRAIARVELGMTFLTGAGMAALVAAGAANLGWVLVWAMITGITGSFGRIARAAILPGLVGPAQLTSAVVLNASSLRISLIVGPMVSGLLIGPVGVGGVLLMSAVACLVALGFFTRVPPQRAAETGPRHGMVASIRAGLVFMRDTSFVRWQLGLLLAVIMLGFSFRDLLSAYASNELGGGSVKASWLVSASGIGGLLATLITPLVAARRGRGRTFVASGLGAGLVLVLFGLQRNLVAALALVAMISFLMIGVFVLSTMITQLTTPNALLGRVIGVQELVVEVGLAVGIPVLGAAGSVIGLSLAITVAGALLTLAAVLVCVSAPRLREVA
jgi:MFS family permease